MWIAISIIMFKITSNFHIGATLIAAILLKTLIFKAVMYVDNTDLVITGETVETTESLVSKAQQIINKWCKILWMTGGCLSPEKFWWFLIEFKWDKKGKWKYKNMEEIEGEMIISDHKQIPQTIQQIDVQIGQQGLGVHLAPDGSQKISIIVC